MIEEPGKIFIWKFYYFNKIFISTLTITCKMNFSFCIYINCNQEEFHAISIISYNNMVVNVQLLHEILMLQ